MAYKYLVIGVAFLALLSYALFLRASNISLSNENDNLTVELEKSRNEILKANAMIRKTQEYAKSLSKTVDDERLKSQDLQQKLSKLEKLSAKGALEKHPKLIENAVNNATSKVGNCFEILSRGGECE